MVEIAWCPGHDGIEGNDKADKLAKKTGKLRALESWRKEHNCRPLRGGFTLSDRLTPLWKPREKSTDDLSTAELDMHSQANTMPNLYRQNAPAVCAAK
ncbi:uncharacterized protein C8R40DRAFT_1124309 [Lentinula edodes]|uniref:uncharacterized protein n=1 Tax=Lentinula edodes TaxID=5353 RepID=UPI001E8E37B9|nr:uncharacterized protein C8R40DRAFT_1124309 [Lentinula edodes]KAH7870892.1 hypothetical protein C8R40DRAFT_1124309 [Lentinula edodes]